MDIHVGQALPTAEERAAVDALLGEAATRWEGGERSVGAEAHVALGGHAARERRHLLLPALHAVNDRIGWISEGALNYICRRLSVPPADAYGVASFYHMFSLKPRSKTVAYVCDDIACMCAGANQLCAELESRIGPASTPFGEENATWLRSPCLGMCDYAPAALLARAGEFPTQWPIAPASTSAIRQAVDNATGTWRIQSRQDGKDLRLLRKEDPGRFAALRKAFEIGPEAVIREVVESKLLGRGGAAFPTGRKWEAVSREAARPHYVVCNADESEPGTFKDLTLMMRRPSAIIEAMAIAAFAGGCERGFIYVRGEYLMATQLIAHAISQARDAGWLGENIGGSGFRFDVEIRRGAGAYICGEETALFNSIEGYRGEPRNKPPFPAQRGLFGKPTIVNNVETLVNVPDIVLDGGKAYAQIGTAESTGTKLFCLSGHVAKPGLYEVPFGVTLRHLIDMAGGVRGGKKLQAVLLGGAAGTFLTPGELDVPLSFEGVRAIKASLGSGVVMLFDETVDLRKILARIAKFFRDESCGQCVPCRVGTVRQEEALHRLTGAGANGKSANDRRLIGEIGLAMRDASICGLGQTASSAIESALAKFDLFGESAPR